MKFIKSIRQKLNRQSSTFPQSENSVSNLEKDQYDLFIKKLMLERPDLDERLIKNLLLNENEYLSYYPDIKYSGLSGVYHYYTYGHKEGREFFEPNLRALSEITPNHHGNSVIFFDTIKTNASFLYRGYFPELRNNKSVILHQHSTIQEILLAIFSAKEMVFIRPSNASSKTRFFMNLCRMLKIKIIIDVDDLLLPDFAEFKGAIRSGVSDFAKIHDDLTRDSSMLLAADEMVCSTKTIANLHSDLIANIRISKNKLPREYFTERNDVENKKIGKKVKILYLSGSKTHLRDYSTISGPLMKTAQNFPDSFSLSFLGMVSDQTAIFSQFGVECNFLPMVTFDEMLQEIRKHDLVLVPLEKTVFNDAKSNIKFIEAASQGVAIIASSVVEYAECLTSNTNGWICDTDEEWYNTLSNLINNPQAIIEASLKAYDSALEGYSI
ncbi:glycosyltransferase [Candidatus Pantoea formicae]|uniref:glycosyltransferase n=1 Tax=Candidatus Pantoea formicae TaxID=2608355 RepID=UPI003ED8E91E